MSSISSTTKAFSILGKLIYSNVDTSVFTEVITNACDSHITAKQIKPVNVTMTGSTIHVQDYGTGIATENIDKVYMNFFESTKEEDSSVCGKFGLGSKCIYYYNTGVFEVKSVVDNKESRYRFSGGDGKHPSKETIYENVDVDAPNGVTVSFKVKDINAVKWHLAKLATFSNVEVDVSAILDPNHYYIENTPPILSGTKWKVYRQTNMVPSTEHMRGATIVQNGLLIQAPVTYSTDNFIVFPLGDKAVPLSLDRTEIKLDPSDLATLMSSLNKELVDYVAPILESSNKFELLSKAKSLLGHVRSYVAQLLCSTTTLDRTILQELQFNKKELLRKWESSLEINAVYNIHVSRTRQEKITSVYDVPSAYSDFNKSWYVLPPRLSNGMNKVRKHMADNGILYSGVIVASDTTNKKDWCLGFDNYLIVDKTWKHVSTPVDTTPKIKDEDKISMIKRKIGEPDCAVKLSELKAGANLVHYDDRAYVEFLNYDEYYTLPVLSSSKDQRILENYLKTNGISPTSTKDVYDYMAGITSTPEFDDFVEQLCDWAKYSYSYNLSRFISYLAPLEKDMKHTNVFSTILRRRRTITKPAYSINYERVWGFVRTNLDNLYYASLVETVNSVPNISTDIKDKYPLLYQIIERGVANEQLMPYLIEYVNLIDSQ
jgi:hypothetical protein